MSTHYNSRTGETTVTNQLDAAAAAMDTAANRMRYNLMALQSTVDAKDWSGASQLCLEIYMLAQQAHITPNGVPAKAYLEQSQVYASIAQAQATARQTEQIRQATERLVTAFSRLGTALGRR